MLYAEVLLPVPLQNTFTYSIPPSLEGGIAVGSRVIVPFGSRKLYTGIVCSVTPIPPQGFEVKEITQLLDPTPIVRHPQIKFWHWIADYYLCTPGEVYKAALPAGLKIESETTVEINPRWEETPDTPLSPRQRQIINALLQSDRPLTVDALSKATATTSVHATISDLVKQNIVIIAERLNERYQPKTTDMVRLTFDRFDNDSLRQAFQQVKQSPKQEKALLTLIHLTGHTSLPKNEPPKPVTRASLLQHSGVTTNIIAALAKKGIVETYKQTIDRFRHPGTPVTAPPQLSPAQQTAYTQIGQAWTQTPVTLLHGVTSSGKTEIYIHLAQQALQTGRQVLYLVPEIALTTQLTSRLQQVFGEKIIVYHSKFTDAQRVEIWRRLLTDPTPCIVIGARSAIFLPFTSLSLVIVDEEHESSYKQQDPAPRYNARDAAIVLASMHGAKTLLGSATPSIETYYKALQGRYGLVSLTCRWQQGHLPHIEITDMRLQRKQNTLSGPFSHQLRANIQQTLEEGHQAIIFLNRRGYAPIARCKLCGYVPKCDNCDVSLTYHRAIHRLVCHYCGTPYQVPPVCPACREPGIEIIGYGTERIQDEITAQFPAAKISRLDLDTTRNKDAYQNTIEEFSAGKTQILVGTQMVTKGLDFAHVAQVGVINADTLLNQPDFRSAERAYCMLSQVAGRAGRRADTPGTVTIQTYTPSHPVITYVQAHDYQGFYQHELQQRHTHTYPPFARIIYIYIKHRDHDRLKQIAQTYADRLRTLLGRRVFGPDEPQIARIQQLYIRRIMLKIETNASMTRVKDLLRQLQIDLVNDRTLASTTLYYDTDPM